MRWDKFRDSDNVEDRRGSRAKKGGLGVGTMIILGLIAWKFNINPTYLFYGAELLTGGGDSAQSETGTMGTPGDDVGRFAAKILGNTEDVWKRVFQEQVGQAYRPAGMVIFSEATLSGCGQAQSAMGPFYCPLDRKVYVDLSFFQQMKQRLGGGGDFAYAYVIAHEVGHHVENELGILGKVQSQQRMVGQTESNQLSVRIELMADCLAGVWAHHSHTQYRSLEPGDIEQALKTAAAIGDDSMQRQSRGYANQESFTHGSSAQRTEWLTKGLKTGRIDSCNTFD